MVHRLRHCVAGVLALALAACATQAHEAPLRPAWETTRAETLARLFAARPASEEHVGTAAGFAVLGGQGKALVRDNATGADTVLALDGAAGEAHAVLIFTERLALHRFQDRGADALPLGGRQMAAASGMWAGAADLAPGVKIYRLDAPSPVVQAAAGADETRAHKP